MLELQIELLADRYNRVGVQRPAAGRVAPAPG